MLFAKALACTGDWHERNVTGEINAIEELAQRTDLTRRHVRQVFPFASRSPQITAAILTARQRPNLAVKQILDSVLMGWRQQAAD